MLASALAGSAEAQTNRLHLGPRVSYQFDLEKVGVVAAANTTFSALSIASERLANAIKLRDPDVPLAERNLRQRG